MPSSPQTSVPKESERLSYIEEIQRDARAASNTLQIPGSTSCLLARIHMQNYWANSQYIHVSHTCHHTASTRGTNLRYQTTAQQISNVVLIVGQKSSRHVDQVDECVRQPAHDLLLVQHGSCGCFGVRRSRLQFDLHFCLHFSHCVSQRIDVYSPASSNVNCRVASETSKRGSGHSPMLLMTLSQRGDSQVPSLSFNH